MTEVIATSGAASRWARQGPSKTWLYAGDGENFVVSGTLLLTNDTQGCKAASGCGSIFSGGRTHQWLAPRGLGESPEESPLERLLVLVGTAVCYLRTSLEKKKIIKIMCGGETALVLQPRVLVSKVTTP